MFIVGMGNGGMELIQDYLRLQDVFLARSWITRRKFQNYLTQSGKLFFTKTKNECYFDPRLIVNGGSSEQLGLLAQKRAYADHTYVARMQAIMEIISV